MPNVIIITAINNSIVKAILLNVSKISFFSQAVYNREGNTYGEGISFARYTPHPFEKWIRAEAYDKDGKCAWSNIIEI